MVTQQIFLPMVPDSAPIVINIAQYDFDSTGYAGRLFFNLVNNGVAYDMDGATAIFQGEKPDGTMFAYPATVVNDSVVRVNVRQQMTVVSGRVVCQLVLSNTDGQIGSFNVWLEVQPSSGSGSDPSETDIPALIAQAKEYADEAEQAAQDAAAWSAHPPYIGANGNWFVYDVDEEIYVDTGVYASGSEGNKWYTGTAVSGKSSTPTVFPTGITNALEGDMYLNKQEGAIYQCTLGGAPTVAKWVYVMTLTGGGGGTDDYPELSNKPQINGVTLVGNQTGHDLGLQNELTEGAGININPSTLELSIDLLAGSNITLETKPSGAVEISSTGGGGTGGHNMIPAPNASLTEEEVVDAFDDAVGVDGGANDDVASVFGITNWSNTMSKTYIIRGTAVDSPIGPTGIGTWDTTQSHADWITIPELIGIGSMENVDFKFTFDPKKSGTIVFGGAWIDDTAGKMCIKFANELSPEDQQTAVVGVEIITKRTQIVDVSFT